MHVNPFRGEGMYMKWFHADSRPVEAACHHARANASGNWYLPATLHGHDPQLNGGGQF